MSIMRTTGGPPHRRWWRAINLAVIAVMAVAAVFAGTSLAKGGPGGGGGGEETTIGNNLSFPTIWADGLQLTLRGSYGSPQTTVPFDAKDANGNPLTLYLQGVEGNTWQAENTVATGPVDVSQVDWGDNIESRTLPVGKPIRVETTLLADLTTPMTGFTMVSAGGSKDTEIFGTDGTQYQSMQAAIYSGCARLTIQRLDISRNDPYISRLRWNKGSGDWSGRGLVAPPVFNGGVWAGGEGTGYSAEINGSGKVVYGYNWRTSGLAAGDYRLTFSLDPNCPAATLNTFMTPATTVYTTTEAAATAVPAAGGPGGGGSGGGSGGGGGGENGGGAAASIDAADNLSYIDVQIGTPNYPKYVPPAPANTVAPAISGTASEGQVLAATSGSWDNAPTSYSYQWQSCDSAGAGCSAVSGAATSSYTLGSADVGHTMRVVVTATSADGSASATSAATAVVVPYAPMSATPPVILGSAKVGGVLLATNGTWQNGPTAYSYQWQLCDAVTGSACADIAGANGGDYTLTDSIMGSRLRVVVTASNAGGSASAASMPTMVVSSGQSLQPQARVGVRITMHLTWMSANRLRVWGDVAPARAGHRLVLQLRRSGGWTTAASVILRKGGSKSSQYSVVLPRAMAGSYRAYMAADVGYQASNSATSLARAQAHVTVKLGHDAQGRMRLTGMVSPARVGKRVVIQVRSGSGWKRFATARLVTVTAAHSTYLFRSAGAKRGAYRVYYGGDSQYRAGVSPVVTAR